MKVEKEQRGKHEQNAVKEGAAGGEDSAVAVTADFFRQNGVERPDEGREKQTANHPWDSETASYR